MKKIDFIGAAVNIIIAASISGAAVAQELPNSVPMAQPQVQIQPSAPSSPAGGDVAAGGASIPSYAEGYAPSARYNNGLVTGGNTDGYIPATKESMPTPPAGVQNPMVMSPMQMDAYQQALRQAFPMSPEMIAYYRELTRVQQEAMLQKPEIKPIVDSGYVSLEPGETPPDLLLASGIATVVSFYDQTGAAWPITQYVHGNANDFQVIQLGKDANSLTVTPLSEHGFSNLIIMLKDEPKPVVMSLRVSRETANYRKDIQVMKPGPNAVISPDIIANPSVPIGREAGSRVLMAALNGADMPGEAQPASVSGVNAQAWVLGDDLYVRSRALLSVPMPLEMMSGPDGVRVYRVGKSPVLTFVQDGRTVMANIDLP